MFGKKNKEIKKEIQFQSLAPTDNAEKSDIYFSALDWAINQKSIKNIAITGNYGSGKSSVLNTYQKNSKSKKRYLNISLATFDKKDYSKDDNVIEKSILQQLFYKEKINKTPFSRFKKINNLNDKLWLKIIVMILIIFSIIWFIEPNWFYIIKDFIIAKFNYNFIIFNNKIDNILNLLIKSIISALSITAIIYLLNVIYKLIVNISYKLTVKKYDVELEITQKDKQNKESIFNKYMDEIIYFFEVTDYDIVVFEDLDRIKNYSGLFVKLRELNILLNNSNIIKKDKITFIYAVKDDVFTNDKERTKFFEFIIPIIPIINSNNSKDKLLDIVKNTAYKDELSDQKFLNNITLYINDMRLLNCIINEFNIYSQQIDVKCDIKKLFSIIVYKNLFPEDFSNLQINKGILYTVMNNKQENINTIIIELKNKYDTLKKEVESLEKMHSTYIVEDFKRIIWTYLNQRYGNISFYINNKQYSTLISFLDDDNINTTEELKKLKVGRYSSNENIVDIIENIEEKIQYTEEELQILMNEKSKELNILEQKIMQIKRKKISEIIKDYGIDKYYKLPEEMSILSYLLKNGYIDESYREYINYFYPTTLKIEDKNFILNFNSQTKTDYSYKLYNIENIIEYFSIEDFSKEEMLNFDLLEYMLQNSKCYNLELQKIFEQLCKSNYGIGFIKEYIVTRKIKSDFIKYFVKYCSDLWDKLMQLLPNNYKRKILHRVLIYAELNDIEEHLAKNKNFIKQVNDCKYFCRLFNDNTIKRAESILNMLKVKFTNIDYKTINSTVFEIIYIGNYYKINLKNIELILNKKLNVDIDIIQTKNYTIISQFNELVNYINTDIKTYISEVFLEYSNNEMEEIDYINELLSNKDLDSDLKEKIIEKEQIINDLSLITDNILVNKSNKKEITIWEIYLEKNKVIPSFKNIMFYYNKYSLNEVLINFINKNSENLEKDIILTLEFYKNFIISVIKDDKVSDKCFLHIVNLASEKCIFNEFDFSNITKSRSEEILCNEKIEIKFNKNTYKSIKENHEELLVAFIEKNIKEFCNSISELEYDINIIIKIITSNNIERNYKVIILSKCDESLEITELIQKETIVDFILKGRKPININYNLFKNLITHRLNINKLIDLVIFQSVNLDNRQLTECLLQFPIPYSNIARLNKVPKLLINDKNNKLKQFLEERKLEYISSITKTMDNKYYKINKRQNI